MVRVEENIGTNDKWIKMSDSINEAAEELVRKILETE